jgi:hypothetical protein
MYDFKGFLQSRTVWAALIGLMATLLQKSGYTLAEVDQTVLVDNVLNIVQIVSYVAAVIFRVKATKQITAQ